METEAKLPQGHISFSRDEDMGTTSLMVDGEEMSMWINSQPPSWVKKLIQVIDQRQRVLEYPR